MIDMYPRVVCNVVFRFALPQLFYRFADKLGFDLIITDTPDR